MQESRVEISGVQSHEMPLWQLVLLSLWRELERSSSVQPEDRFPTASDSPRYIYFDFRSTWMLLLLPQLHTEINRNLDLCNSLDPHLRWDSGALSVGVSSSIDLCRRHQTTIKMPSLFLAEGTAISFGARGWDILGLLCKSKAEIRGRVFHSYLALSHVLIMLTAYNDFA